MEKKKSKADLRVEVTKKAWATRREKPTNQFEERMHEALQELVAKGELKKELNGGEWVYSLNN